MQHPWCHQIPFKHPNHLILHLFFLCTLLKIVHVYLLSPTSCWLTWKNSMQKLDATSHRQQLQNFFEFALIVCKALSVESELQDYKLSSVSRNNWKQWSSIGLWWGGKQCQTCQSSSRKYGTRCEWGARPLPEVHSGFSLRQIHQRKKGQENGYHDLQFHQSFFFSFVNRCRHLGVISI